MRERNEERFQSKKHALMETCFACYAENGLSAVGIRPSLGFSTIFFGSSKKR